MPADAYSSRSLRATSRPPSLSPSDAFDVFQLLRHVGGRKIIVKALEIKIRKKKKKLGAVCARGLLARQLLPITTAERDFFLPPPSPPRPPRPARPAGLSGFLPSPGPPRASAPSLVIPFSFPCFFSFHSFPSVALFLLLILSELYESRRRWGKCAMWRPPCFAPPRTWPAPPRHTPLAHTAPPTPP